MNPLYCGQEGYRVDCTKNALRSMFLCSETFLHHSNRNNSTRLQFPRDLIKYLIPNNKRVAILRACLSFPTFSFTRPAFFQKAELFMKTFLEHFPARSFVSCNFLLFMPLNKPLNVLLFTLEMRGIFYLLNRNRISHFLSRRRFGPPLWKCV